MSEPEYANVRQFLGHFIGRTIVEITQQDQEEWEATKQSYIMLMFDDGTFIKFNVGDEGLEYNDGVEDDSVEPV